MPRRRNKTPFKPYERVTERQGYEVGYIRLVSLQLCCMNELSANAFRLYVMMKSYAKGNEKFQFPHRIYKNFLTTPTFAKARDELVEKGYIEPFTSMANLRKENSYMFSSKWRERSKDKIRQWVSER